MSDTTPQLIGQRLLKRGFRDWFLYMFKVCENRPFVVEPIHQDLFDIFDDIYAQRAIRQVINLPPRSAKTTLSKYFIVYTMTIDPRCNWIYTSYSQSLLNTISSEIAQIFENPIYKAMYPNQQYLEMSQEIKAIDDFWSEYIKRETGKNTYTSKKIITYAGGMILFTSAGGQITGFGCFDYNTTVLTECGLLKIGDIVENKKNVLVWTYNWTTGRKELSPIYNFVKNDGSDFLDITLDNGEHIIATPDHPFYSISGEIIRADQLTVGFEMPANFFNNPDGNALFFRNIRTRVVSVANKIYLFHRKFFQNVFSRCAESALKANALCDFCPHKTAFDVTDRRPRKPIFFCYLFIWPAVACYRLCLQCGKFLKSSVLKIFIICILLCRTIFKIFKTIVRGIGIFMSDFWQIWWRFSNKSKQNKAMDSQCFLPRFLHKGYSFVSLFGRLLFKNFSNLLRINIARFGNKIHRPPRYRKIINIVQCNHNAPSYCITLWNNNNFFVGESQILVHNCGIRNATGFSGGLWLDDFEKIADTTRSEVMRQKTHEYFSQTLLSRLNTPNAVVGCVAQRVNKDDISGYLIDTYGFSVLKKPLLDENGVCQIPSQYTPERIRELQLDDYAWQSQYMQEPIAQANQVFHPDWWRFYDTNDNVPYRRIFITADTANKTREWNDFTAIGVWGVTVQNRLRLLDVIHAKMEIPELQKTFIALWEKWQPGIGTCRCSAIYIEDKASGTQVIQQLRRVGGLPIMAYAPEKDKLSRALDAVPQVAAGNVELPDSPQHPITKEFLRELNNFTADGSALHDDQVDMMTMAVSEAFNQRGYF